MKHKHTYSQYLFRVFRKRLGIIRVAARKLYVGSRHAHSQPISYLVRKVTAGKNLRQILGIQLASMTFMAAVIVPGVDDFTTQITVMKETVYTVVQSSIAEAKFRWPMAVFGISQRFSFYHPGMDLTDPRGTPVYPVADGKVVFVQSQRFGYGNHVLVEHADGVKSLYAHLSKLDVKEGDAVIKDSTIGQVGSTGWSTGNHLHLEVYQNNTPVNPLEVLPAISETK